MFLALLKIKAYQRHVCLVVSVSSVWDYEVSQCLLCNECIGRLFLCSDPTSGTSLHLSDYWDVEASSDLGFSRSLDVSSLGESHLGPREK